VMANVQTFLNRAGINTVPLKLVLFLFLATSLLVIFAIQQLTSSWAIAFSCYVCLFAQLLDSLQNRAAKHTLQQQLQWPNYLDAIHSAIWAGATVQQALVDCSPHAPKTASWAFVELEKDIGSGLDLDATLLNLKSRLASPIADRFVEITRLAHGLGGQGFLPGLKAQASQLRAENANWEEINVKQSWVISSARLAVFAPWLILLLLGTRSETSAAFNTEIGLLILLIGLGASLFAFRLVRLLAKLPERRRILVET
jgi:tight adherence protein B